MSQHRLALAAILVAIVAALSMSARPHTAEAAPAAAQNPIVATALSYDGTYQGECWVFVKKVVLEATGQQMGFDYRQGFFDAGAVEVSAADAQPGDIIQIADDNDTSPDASYSGLHTAIIMVNHGDGTFDVIDSNRDFDGVVHQRPDYNPGAMAARNGLEFHIYRITGDPSVAPPLKPKAAAAPSRPFQKGDQAVTNTPGDVLNLRSTPGGSILTTLQNGTAVSVLSAATTTGGRDWVQVSTSSGTGWVATDFLSLATPDATSASAPGGANGGTKPGLQRRTFVAITSDD